MEITGFDSSLQAGFIIVISCYVGGLVMGIIIKSLKF